MANRSSITISTENHEALPRIELNLSPVKNSKIDEMDETKKTPKAPRQPLDITSKTLFSFSILLAAVSIVLFLFAIPCPPQHDNRIWSTSLINSSISFPVKLSQSNNSQDYVIILVVNANETSTTTQDSHDQYLLALNSSNGHELWRLNVNATVTLFACPGRSYSSKYGYPFDCLVATSSGQLFAFEIASWTIVWRQGVTLDTYPGYCNSAAVTSDIGDIDDVMLACNSHNSDMLDIGRYWIFVSASTGSIKWKSALFQDQQFLSNSIIIDNKSNKDVVMYFTISYRNMSSQVSYIRGRNLSSIISAIDNHDTNTKACVRGGKIDLPSILVDLNSDGHNDILTTFSNGTVIATLGSTMAQYWTIHLRNSSIVNLPAPGHYNDDSYPDIMINFKHSDRNFNEYIVINGYNGKILHTNEKQSKLNYMPANIISIATSNEHSDVFIYPAMVQANTSCSTYSDNSTCTQVLLLGIHNFINDSHSPVLLDSILAPEGDYVAITYSSAAVGYDNSTDSLWMINTIVWQVSVGSIDKLILTITKSSLDRNFKCLQYDSNIVLPSCASSFWVHFLNVSNQPWLSYMGTDGNGIYKANISQF